MTKESFYKFFLLLACATQVCLSARREDRIISPSKKTSFLGNSNAAPSKEDIEATIKEVESLIRSNPSLPRLTRGEILDIIENITKSDESKEAGVRDQKAIMYVMPYSPQNEGDAQDLYTKPPVTHIVDDPLVKDNNRRRPTNVKLASNQIDPVTSKTTRRVRVRTTTTVPTTSPTTTTTTTTTSTPVTTRSSIRQETAHVRRRRPEIPTYKPTIPSTEVPFKPLRRRTTTNPPQTQRYSNHKYPDEVNHPVTKSPEVKATRVTTPKFNNIANEGINIVNPPKFHVKAPPPKTTTTPTLMEEMPIPENFKEVLLNLDSLIKENPKYSDEYDSLTPLPSKILQHQIKTELPKQTTTTTVVPDVQYVANNLSPDMQQLLMSFGLIPDPNSKESSSETPTVAIAPNSETNPESYASFKPLPDVYNGADDNMDEFLARFGLGRNAKRSQKAMSLSKPQNQIKSDKDNLKEILGDIGIKYKESGSSKEEKQHVFNPAVGTEYATHAEIQKLNQLIDVVKQLEKLNGTATEEDLKHIDIDGLKQLVQDLNTPLNEQQGPDPIDYDPGLKKNEVKRQQSTTTTAPASKGPINPSLAALEDSFGGSSDAEKQVITTTTEPPKRTGFYYLVDWNSFFDIDDEQGRRVNLRFQPTIGDPKRFYSVTVP